MKPIYFALFHVSPKFVPFVFCFLFNFHMPKTQFISVLKLFHFIIFIYLLYFFSLFNFIIFSFIPSFLNIAQRAHAVKVFNSKPKIEKSSTLGKKVQASCSVFFLFLSFYHCENSFPRHFDFVVHTVISYHLILSCL